MNLRTISKAGCLVGFGLGLVGCFAPLKGAPGPEVDDPEAESTESEPPASATGGTASGTRPGWGTDASAPLPGTAGPAAVVPTQPAPGKPAPPPATAPVTPPSKPGIGTTVEPPPPSIDPIMPDPSTALPTPEIHEIDAYVLAHSIDQLASLELRRGGQMVWKRSREQIQQFVPQAHYYLSELAFKQRWLQTFWGWTYQSSKSANADALRIAGVLARYFVGVQALTVGPECRPAISSTARAIVLAGSPGDSTFDAYEAALIRSEEEVARQAASMTPGARCFTGVQAAGPAQQLDVIIDLPLDPSIGVGDENIWVGDEQHKQRAGLPAPLGLYPNLRDTPWDGVEVVDNMENLAHVDGYVLRDSIQQLEHLEVRRAGTILFAGSQAQIASALASATTPLTSIQQTRDWVDAFQSLLGAEAKGTDGLQVARALGSYLVGVKTVAIGPRCGPISGGYTYGSATPGVPGDDTPASLSAEVQRSEAAILALISSAPSTNCLTTVHPAPTGNLAPRRVTIDLPTQAGSWLADTQIWSDADDGSRARAGLPVPLITNYWRGSLAF
jgi:hypothetical protein